MAEQLLYRSRIELVDALEILGVNAAGYEQAIDPEAVGACQIGARRIPDGENAVELNRMALALGGERHGALIDRPVRLAVKNHFAAKLAIEFGDGARAIDQPVAAFDDDIGIGADQRQLALARLQ